MCPADRHAHCSRPVAFCRSRSSRAASRLPSFAVADRWQHADWQHRSGSRLPMPATVPLGSRHYYANSSWITLPPLAIFIGRPLGVV